MSQSMKALQAMLTEGISLTEAARRFGISKAAVSKAKLHPPIKRQMAQTIEQLTARVRELEEENARLKAECDDIKQVQFPRKLEAVAVGWKKKLAAEQLNNKRLRDALQEYIDEHEECQDADDWMAMMCSMEAHHTADEALSLPASTEALDKHVDEKVKKAVERLKVDVEFWKGYSKVKLDDLLQQLANLTRQRDLAVEGITRAIDMVGNPDNITYLQQTLDAIKESEGK